MSALGKTLTLLVIMLAIGVGLVFWKSKHPDENQAGAALTKLTKEDMNLLLADENPMAVKQLAEDPDAKQKYVDGLKQFLAVASEARKEGFADNPKYKPLLDFQRSQIIALNYDQEKNKDKGQLPPFSFIKKEQVDDYYKQPGTEDAVNKLVKAFVDLSKEDSADAPDPSPDQIEKIKEAYAKIKIYEKAANDEKDQLGADFARRTDLQVKLQEAATLNQIYSKEVLAKKAEPTDDEIKAYVAQHPEYDVATKKAKAEDILKRAKAGEDFAKLADEYSEDPGNTDPKTGTKKGGIYEAVKPGSGFDKTFEDTALSLQPGQIADNLVETPFGYHIIKLERKGPGKKDKNGKDLGDTYDVRHILITTTERDPSNPFSQPLPLAEKAKTDVAREKVKKLREDILAKNPIEIEDFTVTPPSDEQIQQMMQQQQMSGAPMGGGEDEDEAPAPKGKTPTKPTAAPKKK